MRIKYISNIVFKLAIILFLLFSNCIFDLFNHKDPPTPPEPFKAVKSKKEIMGEWVCYYTYLTWKDGHECFHLDKYKEEDKIIIDSEKVIWRFLKNNNFYEYSFRYLLDTVNGSFFCKNELGTFMNVPIQHWSDVFGRLGVSSIDTIIEWVAIGRLHDTLKFESHPDVYTYETAQYVKKTW